MRPEIAAALLSRTRAAEKSEPPPKPTVGPELVAAAGGPEALLELVRKERLRRQQQVSSEPPEPQPTPAIEPPTIETLADLVGSRGGLAALRAMARAQVSAMPRRPKEKPQPETFVPTDPAVVVQRIEAALAALDGLELQPRKGVRCHQRRYANQLQHAVEAARRELERALTLAGAA